MSYIYIRLCEIRDLDRCSRLPTIHPNRLDKTASCGVGGFFPYFQKNSSISDKNISYPEEPKILPSDFVQTLSSNIKEFMKRLNLFAILIVGCISPWMFSLEKAQTQVLTECQPDQYGNIIDLGDGTCNHTIQSKPEVSFFELINTLNQTSGFSSFFQYYRDQVLPGFERIRRSFNQEALRYERKHGNSFIALQADPNWQNIAIQFSNNQELLLDAIDKYACTKGLYVDSILGATDDSEFLIQADLEKRSYMDLLIMLDLRINYMRNLSNRGDLNRLNLYVDSYLFPALETTTKKLKCLQNNSLISSSESNEMIQELYDRMDIASEILKQ